LNKNANLIESFAEDFSLDEEIGIGKRNKMEMI